MAISKIFALSVTDPEAAKKQILKAIEATKNDRTKAAAMLELKTRTFYRMIGKLHLWDDIQKLCEAKGFEIIPGPPHAHQRILTALFATRGNVKRAASRLNMTEESLYARVRDLGLLEELNQMLKAASYPAIVLPALA